MADLARLNTRMLHVVLVSLIVVCSDMSIALPVMQNINSGLHT